VKVPVSLLVRFWDFVEFLRGRRRPKPKRKLCRRCQVMRWAGRAPEKCGHE
jgi:hypothetical protein